MWEGRRGEDSPPPHPLEPLHHHHHHHHHVHHALQPMPAMPPSYGAYPVGLGYAAYPPPAPLNAYNLHHSAIPTAHPLSLQGLGPYPNGLSEANQYLDISNDHRRVRRRLSSEERLERNRERNRMHAKKTRQRKKQHMTELTQVRKELEDEQRKLKQAINDRKTAKILLVMSASGRGEDKSALLDSSSSSDNEGPSGMMDGSRQHHHKIEADSPGSFDYQQMDCENGSDNSDTDSCHSHEHDLAAAKKLLGADEHHHSNKGCSNSSTAINYALLKKDRALCTPEELDEIRRERNRMHARRTRERKKKLLKQAQTHIESLERENKRLQEQLHDLDGIVMTNGERVDVSSIHHALSPLSVAPPIIPPQMPREAPGSGTTSSSHGSSGMSSGSSSGGSGGEGKGKDKVPGSSKSSSRRGDGSSDTSSDSGTSDEVMMGDVQWTSGSGSNSSKEDQDQDQDNMA